ncbi:MAG: hypothetical protein BMS9Abin12_0236 [Acidimicrobiia bacterium]|nr:MAG: hypothetical protein BMS9Abin12_0236 [Acidimicrobiia bacterium]
MITAIVLAVVAFLVIAAVLSRQTTKTKKRAIADLETEKENVGEFDIFELVESEVRTLELTTIEGAQGLPHGVLLKAWSNNQNLIDSCHDRDHLRYVVAAGIKPSDATDEDVTLECPGH